MYESFFGLEHPPFQISPDPEFLYPSRVHEEALEHIRFSLNHFKGICLVTGPVGSGKTTICRKILRELNPEGVNHALILNPRLEENELLQNILSDLGAPAQNHEGAAQKLQELILELHKVGRHVIILVDEAHVMPTESLEVLRLLTNLETTERKLVQVVLFAQPEMEERLKKESRLLPFRQRILVHCRLAPLRYQEMVAYIDHRLHIAGAADEVRFSMLARRAIHRWSEGVPRLINHLCDKAMLSAYVRQDHRIHLGDAQRARRDVGALL
jgi:general secretion pathway protein A